MLAEGCSIQNYPDADILSRQAVARSANFQKSKGSFYHLRNNMPENDDKFNRNDLREDSDHLNLCR